MEGSAHKPAEWDTLCHSPVARDVLGTQNLSCGRLSEMRNNVQWFVLSEEISAFCVSDRRLWTVYFIFLLRWNFMKKKKGKPLCLSGWNIRPSSVIWTIYVILPQYTITEGVKWSSSATIQTLGSNSRGLTKIERYSFRNIFWILSPLITVLK